jgi:hypothetical protein
MNRMFDMYVHVLHTSYLPLLHVDQRPGGVHILCQITDQLQLLNALLH